MKHRAIKCSSVLGMLATAVPSSAATVNRGVPSNDRRLLTPVTIVARTITLRDALALMSAQSHVELSVQKNQAGFHDILIAHRLPLRNMMIGIAWANRMTWTPTGAGYRLAQTAQQWAMQTDAIEQTKRQSAFFAQTLSQSYLASIQRFIAKDDRHNPATFFLDAMDADTLNALASTANRQLPAFPAGGNANFFRNYLFGITRFTDLSHANQRLIENYFGGQRTVMGTVPSLVKRQAQFVNEDFGLYTQDGQLYLAVIGPHNGAIWWPNNYVADRKYLVGYDINDDDTDPRVVKLLPKAHFDLTEPLPARLAHPTLVLKTSQYLPNLMSQLYHTTGAAVICTRFLNSLHTRIQGLWTFEDKFPLTEAVREVDRAFGYHSAWFGGMLVSRTTDPGPNILNEPPAGLVTRMASFSLGKAPMSQNDLQLLADMNHEQWVDLWHFAVANKAFHVNGYEIGPNWRAAFMKLFGSLTTAQLVAAASPAGIPANQLTAAQRMQLILATDMGALPPHPAPVPAGLQAGFYVHVSGTPASVKAIRFIAAYPYLGKLRVTPWIFTAKMGQNYLSVAKK